MGIHFMEILLHVFSSGGMLQSKGDGLSLNGKLRLMHLMRPLHWGLHMVLTTFPLYPKKLNMAHAAPKLAVLMRIYR